MKINNLNKPSFIVRMRMLYEILKDTFYLFCIVMLTGAMLTAIKAFVNDVRKQEPKG